MPFIIISINTWGNGCGNQVKTEIQCPFHTSFWQTPNDHLQGRGCNLCAKEFNKLTHEQNVSLFKEKHGSKYEYLSDCTSPKKKESKLISIKCPDHGIFKQSLKSHKEGAGCPKCAHELKTFKDHDWYKASLISRFFDSYKIYTIKCKKDNEEFIKIGKTFTTICKRFNTKKLLPYDYEIIDIKIYDDFKQCCEHERQLHLKFKDFRYNPLKTFAGRTECFTLDILPMVLNE